MPPRNRILLEQRQRIIRAFEDVHKDYLMVADTIGVNKSTAKSIVTRYVPERRIAERLRGGPNHVRVDNEMRDCLNDILNENCLLTLAQITQELRQRLPYVFKRPYNPLSLFKQNSISWWHRQQPLAFSRVASVLNACFYILFTGHEIIFLHVNGLLLSFKMFVF